LGLSHLLLGVAGRFSCPIGSLLRRLYGLFALRQRLL